MTEIQQSLFDEESRIEQVERDKRIHKTAFRVAFDLLQAHYPPENTEEYWLKTAKEVGIVSCENNGNMLCQELLSGIIEYLNWKVKTHAENR